MGLRTRTFSGCPFGRNSRPPFLKSPANSFFFASPRLGATPVGKGDWEFLVWAPRAQKVEAVVVSPRERVVRLDKTEHGYHHAVIEGIEPGSLYFYRLDGKQERPDPASRYQPNGVHGPSQVLDSQAFQWDDTGWAGLLLENYIIYEVHVGTYTREGTFDAMIPHLDELKELGVTAIEIMPVAQFPGDHNWGYDGVYPFAAQSSYGGPEGLQRLVNACHQRGLAFVLDVVYNHLGPEGNYLRDFGPYFTNCYRTPWGPALNFDGPQSDEVRRFFIESALYWVAEFHVDGLRLDAIHGIVDVSAQPFLGELADTVHSLAKRLGRRVYLIAESDLNDARALRPPEFGGYGLDAQWSDDFHHALHALLTGELIGYYRDFGELKHLVKALTEGFVYSGQYSVYRQRRHGNSSRAIPAYQFVVYIQNHDQIGNRMAGDRLSQLVTFEALKLGAGVAILSPFIPLLFMGEEYKETSPFQYFTSHSDPELVKAVRRGRREQFAAFDWEGEVPDPQDESTFLRSKLDHSARRHESQGTLREFYKKLVQLRRNHPALRQLSKEHVDATSFDKEKVLVVHRWSNSAALLMVFNFSDDQAFVTVRIPRGSWRKEIDSAEERWCGRGSSLPATFHSRGQATLQLSPKALVVFTRISDSQD